MPEPQDVASRYDKRRRLWMAAIKWPMYSVAVMPVLLAAGWRLGAGLGLRWDQLLGFLLAAILAAVYGTWVPCEETYLERHFGARYVRYRRATPRWFGVPYRNTDTRRD